MASNGQTETFTIRIDSNAAKTAREDAAELENLRKRFDATSGALKTHEAALKRLQQGKVVNIQAARELKQKIDDEKSALAAMTEKVTAAGKSFEGLAVESKKNDDKMKEATKSANELTEAFGTGLVAAILAVEGAAVLATAALGKFVIESASLARSQQLAREAVTGSEEDARRLGTQVDALALKVPLAKAAINEMAVDMRKAGITGQTLVDTLNATAQAASAVGDETGKKLRDLVERGRLTQRFSLGQFELQGSGLDFGDVAAALAKNTKTSIQDASVALIQGRVTLGEGAAALRTAVEKKFGGLNLAKMLDIDVMKRKFVELLQSLTANVDMTPLLDALKDFFSLFDQSTEAGAALKDLTTAFGQGFVNTVSKGLPIAKGFFEELILLSLDLYIEILKLELRFKKAFGDKDLLKNIDLVETGVTAAKIAVTALTIALVVLGTTTAIALIPLAVLFGAIAVAVGVVVLQFVLLKKGFDALVGFGSKLANVLGNKDTWKNVGADIIQGLLDPLMKLEQMGATLGKKFIAGFRGKDGIDAHSPSRKFFEAGEDSAEGYGQGVDRKSSNIAATLGKLATPAPAAAGGSGVVVKIESGAIQVQVIVQGEANARELAQDRNFLDAITQAVERGARSVGQKVAA